MKKIVIAILLIANLFALDSTTVSLSYNHVSGWFIWQSQPYKGVTKSELEYPYAGPQYRFSTDFHLKRFEPFFNIAFSTTLDGKEGYDTDWSIDVMMYKARCAITTNLSEINVGVRYAITPSVKAGVYYNWQNFRFQMTDGYWILYTFYGGAYLTDDPIPNLRSRYGFTLSGLGYEVSGETGTNLKLLYGFSYTRNNLAANATWNLRDLNFEQKGTVERLKLHIAVSHILLGKIRATVGMTAAYIYGKGKMTSSVEMGKPWNVSHIDMMFKGRQQSAYLAFSLPL